MVTLEDLKTLLSDLESDRVERTTSTQNTDKFAEAICAFANDLPHHQKPGYLLIGVDDDGRPSGLKVTDQLLQNLADLKSAGNILPVPTMTVTRHLLPEGEVAVVEVHPSDLPPVRYKGRVRIRVGPRRGIASEQDERILSERRTARVISFDASPLPGTSIDDLMLGIFAAYRSEAVDPTVIEANHRTTDEQLASLRCFDLMRGCATVAGILLFGMNPRYHLPGAYVQYAKFAGPDLTSEIVDQAELSGDLQTILRELETRLRAVNQTHISRVSGFRETMTHDFPEIALQQIVYNAVMHRDYQSNTPIRVYCYPDRIDVHSPGGLFGEVTRDTLERRSSYRNPVIAEFMKTLGYVNRFGMGIRLAQSHMQRNGNPPVTFECDDRTFLATLSRRPS